MIGIYTLFSCSYLVLSTMPQLGGNGCCAGVVCNGGDLQSVRHSMTVVRVTCSNIVTAVARCSYSENG